MSLIHTCELNGVNPFDYLTELQQHAEELARSPEEWMPGNYRAAVERSVKYDESRMAGKDSLRPGGPDILKCL